ncbi:centrosomal protein of 104 kDa [Spea bombifrons]|uniref:centrosomal protein of 104 kDa n=1 Tax=Spea bombifrons TaxID=233779 RepID=UPI00234A8FE3|nr:centrosomal protein of 104 kDa [Spea bombifrons]XP_053307349.1 centrosomal protein of 104 kDa [Spea bombifrons]
MPHKIGFVVVSSSGHEDGFSAKELMVHAPTVTGWRSPRFCQYPQEIVLQMVERCRIRKLQLLAHQYMISSKIEFYVSESLPEYFTPYQSERFRRLGYVSLSDNEKTSYKARELKSVYVDAVGQYLKLIFHKNYANRYNLYNQVALIAINIIGDPVDFDEENNAPTRDKLIDQYLGNSSEEPAMDSSYIGKPDSISPLDDLAFDMYQDPEVAQIIRKLDEKKQEAVRHERYDYAKKLKQAIADLQKVGERLGRYEVEKRCAVEKEDYDLAKRKKQQMEEYRQKVYQQLELHDLLDTALIRRGPELSLDPLESPTSPQLRKTATSPPPDQDKTIERRAKRERQIATEKPPKMSSPKPVQQPRSPSPPPPPAPAPSAVAATPNINIDALPYDERPLPAQRKSKDEAFTYLEPESIEETAADTPRTKITGEPEPLTEKALREASFAIEVFGEALVAGAYSKTWSYREDALLAVYKKLSDIPSETSKDDLKTMLRAAIFLVRRAIKDKVTSVFQASLRLLKMIITHYIPKHKLGKSETTHCVEKTLPDLLSRTGDSATRYRLIASNFIQEMALFKEVKPLQIITVHLVQPLKATLPSRLALSQMELVDTLIAELGVENSGFTVDNVMKLAIGALEYTTSEVRDKAVRMILYLYKQHRSQVLGYMPTDDSNTRRNILYKTLFDGFAKIDGRPTDAELKAQKKALAEEAERQKKEEIRALQEQLAALKEMQAEALSGKTKDANMNKTKNDERGKKATLSPNTEASDRHSSGTNYLDNLCIFCGERDESFNEEGLDLHYWKHCPMLKRCEQCKQVVEIASLMDHLLTECDQKELFGKCQRCSEAVFKEVLTEHLKAKSCNPSKGDKVANRCPLCHENFMPGEEAWKSHLMGKDGCKANPRRTQALQRTQLASHAAVKVGGSAVTKPGPVLGKQRAPVAGSKIPAPRAGLNKTMTRAQPKR